MVDNTNYFVVAKQLYDELLVIGWNNLLVKVVESLDGQNKVIFGMKKCLMFYGLRLLMVQKVR